MKVISYSESGRQAHWLSRIAQSGWAAGDLLYRLIKENRFHEALGAGSEVLLLTDGDELVSFCTYAEKDDVRQTELTPWMGFVFTFPQYRGHRYIQLLFDEVMRRAAEDGRKNVYISTDHIGLYERYGCRFLTEMKNIEGEMSRIYVKTV